MKTNNAVVLSLLVNGKPVTTYGREGRTFVEGREGTNFTLRVKNNTAGRVEAVVSVDGKSVVDGEVAKADSVGYIIPAYGSYEIPGWRVTDETCAKFVFKKGGESYAVKTGSPLADLGVIGLMAWSEKAKPVTTIINTIPVPYYVPIAPPVPVYPSYPWYVPTYGSTGGSITGQSLGVTTAYSVNCSNSPMRCCDLNLSTEATAALSASAPEFKLGTGWGEITGDKITHTTFERGELLVQLEVHYSTAEALKAAGIEMAKPVALPVYPTAFKYCRPPS